MSESLARSASHGDASKLARQGGILLLGRIGGRASLILHHLLLARVLGPTSFGLYAIGWTVLGLAATIAPLGIEQGVIRFGTCHWQRRSSHLRGILRRSAGLASVSALLVAALLFIGSEGIAALFEMPELAAVVRWFAFASVGWTLLKITAAMTRLSQNMRYTVLDEELAQPASALLLFLCFYFVAGWALLGAVAATTLSFFFALLLAAHHVRSICPAGAPTSDSVPKLAAGELLGFSVPAALAGLFAFHALRIDRLLIGYFLTADAAGIYHAASQTAAIGLLFQGCFNTIMAPMISSFAGNGERYRLAAAYRLSTRWNPTVPRFAWRGPWLVSAAPCSGSTIAASVTATADPRRSPTNKCAPTPTLLPSCCSRPAT